MSAFTVLITGANRGLGLEFAKQYATEGWRVLACCRQPQSAIALQALAAAHHNVQIFSLDVSDFKQIETLASTLHDTPIDVLINNAGVYPESSFGDSDETAWAHAFKVNSMAPLKMAEAFVTHLSKSQLKKIATLSSKMGSIDDTTSGESYIYRTSKCAVNMVMKNLSIDLKPYGISVVTLHPGWVRTEMGGPNGLIDAPESAAGLRTVIALLNLGNSGKFIAFDGKEIAW
ncbi:MAG TPA: SDR family oxidoreductase [Methylotenera sp.]|nr:SDR family oxidoreductase [Methylotenera sp.]HPH05645.1 SDR family oxidoreductase [Methylotenera sp.]HPN01325.1 SDR family oxidoreductase [Methylotenera sp.]